MFKDDLDEGEDNQRWRQIQNPMSSPSKHVPGWGIHAVWETAYDMKRLTSSRSLHLSFIHNICPVNEKDSRLSNGLYDTMNYAVQKF